MKSGRRRALAARRCLCGGRLDLLEVKAIKQHIYCRAYMASLQFISMGLMRCVINIFC